MAHEAKPGWKKRIINELRKLSIAVSAEREVRLTTVRYEAVMLKRSVAFVFAISLLGLAGRITIHAASLDQAPAAEQDLSDEESVHLLAQGKEIFLERCARCHNESGDKPLKTGAPLNQRGLSTDVIAQAVNGRLRDRTEGDRHAVTLYISSLMLVKDSEKKIAPKP